MNRLIREENLFLVYSAGISASLCGIFDVEYCELQELKNVNLSGYKFYKSQTFNHIPVVCYQIMAFIHLKRI